jgi:hypothetical protein
MEELCVIFSLFNLMDSASFSPIYTFRYEKIFKMELNNGSKIILQMKEWSFFFQRNFIAILDQSF